MLSNVYAYMSNDFVSNALPHELLHNSPINGRHVHSILRLIARFVLHV